MDPLIFEFEDLKLSAFSKFSQLNKEEVNKLTIGPNSTCDTDFHSNKEKVISNVNNTITLEKKDTKTTPIKKVCLETTDVTDKAGVPFRQIVNDIKSENQIQVQNAMQLHLHELNHHAEYLEKYSKNSWLRQQEQFIKSINQQERDVMQALEEYEANKDNENERLRKYYELLAERRKKLELTIQAKKNEREELRFIVANIKKNQLEFSRVYKEVISLVKSCQTNDNFKKSISEELKGVKSLLEVNDQLINKCKNCNVDRTDIKKSVEVLQQILQVKQTIQNMVEKKPADKVEIKLPEQSTVNNEKLDFKESLNNNKERPETVKLDKYVSKSNLKRYSEMNTFLDDYSKSFLELINNPSMKQLRFDCKKAINLTINAISAVSSQHLLDKYIKLSNLLSGKNVTISDTQINAMKHPQGIAFCTDLLAQKFVLQGDLLISSNPDAAFSYATIINSLWNTFPDFGKLFLAYIYKDCPYIVPIYNPKLQEQSDEDFYKTCGYKYNNGQIEKQDKFLKRMMGIMRLYSAILITKPKSDQKSSPHGIEFGWKWLTSVLKLQPQLDITATMLHTFIETAGYEMELVYGKSFKKLINIITVKFMPILKEIDSGGPAARLDILLQEYKQRGCFEKPDAQLPTNFW